MVFAVLVRWPTGLVLWHSEASSGAPTGQRRVSCRGVIPSECQLEKEREEILLNNAGNLPRQKTSSAGFVSVQVQVEVCAKADTFFFFV